ncbi:MAG: 30S ribosomal protein S7 [Chitinophagales bacterium]
MRKARAPKRYLQPDPKFGDPVVTQFVNNLMYEGKKSIAYAAFYNALDLIEERTKENPLEIWRKAVQNCSPSVEVKSKRIGGANFQVPVEVRPERRLSVAIKWLVQYSRERNGKTIADKLANELVAASKGEGGAFKKKEDVHRMAEANKAFSHFKF